MIVTESTATIDTQDERLMAGGRGLPGILRSAVRTARGGDLGSLPVVVGLVVIAGIFQSLNHFFLSSPNMVNLTMESAAAGTMALGIVVILLLGQIDLSVGSVSGLAAAVAAVGLAHWGWPLWLSVVAAVVLGAAIGVVYAQVFSRFGVPSFVVTLAGLMAALGLQLLVLDTNGSVSIPFDSWLVQYAQQAFVPPLLAYTLVAAVTGGAVVLALRRAAARRREQLSSKSSTVIVLQGAAVLAVLLAVVWYLNLSRGVSVMFLTFCALVLALHYALTRTKWGRSVFAVGGNVEAARRAGIRVDRVYLSAFILCSTLAAVGGLMAAGRLASANPSSGGGDTNLTAIAAAVIGGTSLFGGRGSALSALLGILVVSSISSGLTLLSLDSSIRFLITGGVLLAAVIVDAVARRSRAQRGIG